MQRLKKLFKKEDGVSMVIVALMLTVLLAMAGLALDIGCAYYNRTKLQAACDAAALAAAQKLLDSSTDTCTAMGQECFRSNFTPEQLASEEFELTNDYYEYKPKDPLGVKNDTVTTRASMKSPTVFARVLNINELNISVQATAYVHGASEVDESVVVDKVITSSTDGYIPNASGAYVYKVNHYGGIKSNGDVYLHSGTIIDNNITVQQGSLAATLNLSSFPDKVIQTTERFDMRKVYDPVESHIDLKEEEKLNSNREVNISVKESYYEDVIIPENSNVEISSSTEISFHKNLTIKKGAILTINADVNYAGPLISECVYDRTSLRFVGDHLTIEEGAMLRINGNFRSRAETSIVCDGIFYVTGNCEISGPECMTTPGKTGTSYVYVGGSNAAFSLYKRDFDNAVFCVPNGELSFSGNEAIIYGAVYADRFQANVVTTVVKKNPFDHDGRKVTSLIG